MEYNIYHNDICCNLPNVLACSNWNILASCFTQTLQLVIGDVKKKKDLEILEHKLIQYVATSWNSEF